MRIEPRQHVFRRKRDHVCITLEHKALNLNASHLSLQGELLVGQDCKPPSTKAADSIFILSERSKADLAQDHLLSHGEGP